MHFFSWRENANESIYIAPTPKNVCTGQPDAPEGPVQPKQPADSPHVRRSERLATIPPVYWGKRRRSTDSSPKAKAFKQASPPLRKTPNHKSGPRQAANKKTARNTTTGLKHKTKKSTSAAVNKLKTTAGRWQVPGIYICVCV